MNQAAGVALRNLRIAAAIILFQLISGTAVMLRPDSMLGYNPLITLPVVFSLLPGGALVTLLLKIASDQYEQHLERIHYIGPTPAFPPPVWAPAVLAIGGIVLFAALRVVKGRPGGPAYWTLVIAEASCVLSPLGLLFFGFGKAMALGLIPAPIPLIALALLIGGRPSRTFSDRAGVTPSRGL